MKKFQKIPQLLLFFLVFQVQAQNKYKNWSDIIRKNDASWFATSEAKSIAENVLLYQRNIGGWPKNIQIQKPLSATEKQELLAQKSDLHNITTDNGATCQEMLFLAKMYQQTPDKKYKDAFLLGLNYILEAQYDNGGWPQFYPLKKGYYTHITYNDDSMYNILLILKEIIDTKNYLTISIPEDKIETSKIAFNKGIDCIIKTQYKQNGILTAWCAQHDEYTLQPAKARAYELPSLSGKESAKIVLLLMSIENPSPEVVTAVDAAYTWFQKVKLVDTKEERIYNDAGKIIDKKIIHEQGAPDLWARFMELEDNRPFFCDRDGIKKYSLDEIGAERRNGYAWYTNEPKEVIKKYDSWKKKLPIGLTKPIQKTAKKPKDEYNIIVAKDESGDYNTIQEAINNSPSFPYKKVTITIKNGTYREKIKIAECNPNIQLIGEDKEKTILIFDDNFSKINLGRNSTFYTPTLAIEADNCTVSNLTIANDSGDNGQAIALSITGNRVKVVNCNLTGNQDTLYLNGENNKVYLTNCYIDGTTDFIFGNATAWFENCTINSKKDSYITAASTTKTSEFGFVFKNCKITAESDVKAVYLGRPWRIYAKTVFIECEMGTQILPEGWENWKKPEAETTSFYAEYNCSGKGFQPTKRVSWSHQLTKKQAKKYTLENVLSDQNYPNWYKN